MDITLLAALFSGQLSTALLLLCLHKKGDQTFPTFMASMPGLLASASATILVIVLAIIAWRWRAARKHHARTFALTLAMNIVCVTVILITGEIAIRALSRPVFEGTPLFNDDLLLLPRNWNAVSASYLAQLERSGQDSAFIHDPMVGWSLRPGHSDEVNFYTTSAEGLRSATPGVVYRDRRPRTRIALVGDSFTFADDVSYEDSWGNRLEETLGSDVQVLNFGVSGYGVDQAYLRYEHAVKPWRADVVIFGVYPADVERAMAVYPFIRRPAWGNPYSKPRLLRINEGLSAVNVPTQEPADVFSAPTITALPHLAFDRGYRAFHWQRSWPQASFLVRFLTSRFPRQEAPDPVNDDSAMQAIALEIFRQFQSSVTADGSQAVFVYLPSQRDVDSHTSGNSQTSVAKRILSDAGIAHIDLTQCIARLPRDERYMFGGSGHYTPRANKAAAECIASQISM